MSAAFPSVMASLCTSSTSPNSQRECLQAMLRTVVGSRKGTLLSFPRVVSGISGMSEGTLPHKNLGHPEQNCPRVTNHACSSGAKSICQSVTDAYRCPGSDRSDAASQRRRAASAANLEPLPDVLNNGRPESEHSRHSRASSDLSLLRGFSASSNDAYYRGSTARSPRAFAGGNFGDEALNPTVSTQLRQPGVRIDVGDPFNNEMDESDVDSFRTSMTEDLPVLQRSDENFMERQARSTGVTFDELVDRLLAPRMTRADQNFADIFLCLYRKFAAPGQLFSAILKRLERAKDDKSAHYLTKKATQMRIIEVVARWVSLYPGDFARPLTKKTLDRFISHLATEPAFLAAASMMRAQLENCVVEDDDTGWAKSDDPPPEGEVMEPPKTQDLEMDLGGSMDSLTIRDPSDSADRRRPSATSECSSQVDRALGTGETNYQYFTYDDYEREAATMVPQATLPLSKMRYHIFIDLSAEDLAEEITRIDWIMFSSVRIRDWVRHVSLPASEKERCRSLKNANRLISHFNHVAKWVQNMILIRDKAKHRAPCLEKFMIIAHKLRKLNNYNGLGAIVAGLQNANIARLHATMQGVRPEVWKQYQSAEKLMLQTKSSFAYRLAWENSPLPRIPYMALHRKDLTAAEEGNKTFVGPNGDRINWKKFEILGEILLPIMKSQGSPYANLSRQRQDCRELILDCRMELDEDVSLLQSLATQPDLNHWLTMIISQTLYQRSKAVEPGPGATSSSTSDLKKKTLGFLKGG